jgi:hypothetical protein
MNHYYTSDGQRISKQLIERYTRDAKKVSLDSQFYEFGYNFCVDCLVSSGVYLDCSHTISVNEAQKTRRSELAYDHTNIKIRCRECHIKHDNQSRIK